MPDNNSGDSNTSGKRPRPGSLGVQFGGSTPEAYSRQQGGSTQASPANPRDLGAEYAHVTTHNNRGGRDDVRFSPVPNPSPGATPATPRFDLGSFEWQFATTRDRTPLVRIPTQGMTERGIEGIMQNLRNHGLHPERGESNTLGPVIRLEGKEAMEANAARKNYINRPPQNDPANNVRHDIEIPDARRGTEFDRRFNQARSMPAMNADGSPPAPSVPSQPAPTPVAPEKPAAPAGAASLNPSSPDGKPVFFVERTRVTGGVADTPKLVINYTQPEMTEIERALESKNIPYTRAGAAIIEVDVAYAAELKEIRVKPFSAAVANPDAARIVQGQTVQWGVHDDMEIVTTKPGAFTRPQLEQIQEKMGGEDHARIFESEAGEYLAVPADEQAAFEGHVKAAAAPTTEASRPKPVSSSPAPNRISGEEIIKRRDEVHANMMNGGLAPAQPLDPDADINTIFETRNSARMNLASPTKEKIVIMDTRDMTDAQVATVKAQLKQGGVEFVEHEDRLEINKKDVKKFDELVDKACEKKLIPVAVDHAPGTPNAPADSEPRKPASAPEAVTHPAQLPPDYKPGARVHYRSTDGLDSSGVMTPDTRGPSPERERGAQTVFIDKTNGTVQTPSEMVAARQQQPSSPPPAAPPLQPPPSQPAPAATAPAVQPPPSQPAPVVAAPPVQQPAPAAEVPPVQQPAPAATAPQAPKVPEPPHPAGATHTAASTTHTAPAALPVENAPHVKAPPGAHRLQTGAGAAGVAIGAVGLKNAIESGDTVQATISGADVTANSAELALNAAKNAGKAVPSSVLTGAKALGTTAAVADGAWQIYNAENDQERTAAGVRIAATTGAAYTTSAAIAAATGGAAAGGTAAGATAAGTAAAAAGGITAGAVATVAAPIVIAAGVGLAVDHIREEDKKTQARHKQTVTQAERTVQFEHGVLDASRKPNVGDYGNLRQFAREQTVGKGMQVEAFDKMDFSKPENIQMLKDSLKAQMDAKEAIIKENTNSVLPDWMRTGNGVEKRMVAERELGHLTAVQKELTKFEKDLGAFDPESKAKMQAAAAERKADIGTIQDGLNVNEAKHGKYDAQTKDAIGDLIARAQQSPAYKAAMEASGGKLKRDGLAGKSTFEALDVMAKRGEVDAATVQAMKDLHKNGQLQYTPRDPAQASAPVATADSGQLKIEGKPAFIQTVSAPMPTQLEGSGTSQYAQNLSGGSTNQYGQDVDLPGGNTIDEARLNSYYQAQATAPDMRSQFVAAAAKPDAPGPGFELDRNQSLKAGAPAAV